MNVLIVGSGAREHALAWKIARSPLLGRLVCAPGNPGMAHHGDVRAVAATDVEGQVGLAREMGANLVIVGPETALAEGLADRLAAVGIACFGPSAAAARLETSKAFAKTFAQRQGLPSGRFAVFENARAAKQALGDFAAPYVIKADGLAAGKGVVIAETEDAAGAAIEDVLGGRFGAAGSRVVIEEFLQGEIASLFALSDGHAAVMFGAVQDHKRAFDGETGPNTGGMGAYAPAPVVSVSVLESARHRLIEPALAGIAAEGAPFKGALFCEVMVTPQGPRLVEFNARFGDPECQVLMMRLEDDLLPYLAAAAQGGLADLPAPSWRNEAVIAVVLASRGYPGEFVRGGVIGGAEESYGHDVEVFQAGTARRADGALIAAGGRVLTVCARAPTLADARARAYEIVDRIDFPHGFCRRDIGWRALRR